MNDQEILKVARELAAKSDISFDDLADTDIMRGAYLHNAEEAIKDRRMSPGPTGAVKPTFTCPRCQDKAYIGGERCRECNPMGLPVEEVHPGAVVDISPQKTVVLPLKVLSRPIDLSPSTLPEDTNVPKPAVTPKKGEYLCTKCNAVHRETSRVGKKHLEFKQ